MAGYWIASTACSSPRPLFSISSVISRASAWTSRRESSRKVRVEEWQYKPAQDLGLSEGERLRSVKRESGLVGTVARHLWWWWVRGALRLTERIELIGREHLPPSPPFVLVANHSSHLDAMVLATALPLRLRNCVFPLAAGDTFFETPVMAAFAAEMMNALPM